jgi:hypothetical protein
MNKFMLLLNVVFITSCASQIMQGYVGKDMREVMLDYGPPANAFDMGDGRRAFQWVMNSSYTTPTYATTTGNVNSVGNSAWFNSNTQIHGGQTYTQRCAYTLFGRWDEGRQGWTVIGFKQPKLMCE